MSVSVAGRLTDLWWHRLTLAVARRSPGLGNGLTDGLHLTRWPAVAAYAPPLAALTGFAAAALVGPTLSRSLVLTCLLLAVGAHSVLLGAFAWTGFVLGDLVVPEQQVFGSLTVVQRWVGGPLSVLESWLLVGVLVVLIPLSVLSFRLEVRRAGWHRALGDPGERAVVVAFAVGFTWLWVTAMPVLVRPIFTLRGDLPVAADIAPVQRFWWVPTGVALLAWAGRMVLERRALGEAFVSRVRTLAIDLASLGPGGRIPEAVTRPLTVAAATLALAGMIDEWWWVPIVVAVLFAGLWLRDRAGRLAWLTRVPLVYRFIAGLVVGFLVIRATLTQLRPLGSLGLLGGDSFALPLAGVLASITLTALLTAPEVRR
jgi:hypothetical protein